MLSMIGCETTECNQIRLAKQACYQQRFTEYTGDSQKTWQTISELTSRKPMQTKYFHLSAFNSLLLYFSLDKSYLL